MVGDGEKGRWAGDCIDRRNMHQPFCMIARGDAFGSHSAAANENYGDPTLFERSTRVPISRYLDLEREGVGGLLNL